MSDAREFGEELKARLRLMGHRAGLFDNDPELDDHDPKYGAHLTAHGVTQTVVVDLPHIVTNGFCCWGTVANDLVMHEQPLRHDQVVDFIIANLT